MRPQEESYEWDCAVNIAAARMRSGQRNTEEYGPYEPTAWQMKVWRVLRQIHGVGLRDGTTRDRSGVIHASVPGSPRALDVIRRALARKGLVYRLEIKPFQFGGGLDLIFSESSVAAPRATGIEQDTHFDCAEIALAEPIPTGVFRPQDVAIMEPAE